MFWHEAKALIDEARALKYKGNEWERNFIARLERTQPAELWPGDAQNLNNYYRKAAGGGVYVRKYF